jgi:hypothetical protein
MSDISDVVTIQITTETAAVTQPSFSIPMVIGPSNRFSNSDIVREYDVGSATASMLADGFMTSDPEYIRVSEIASQPITPQSVLVGKNTASVASVDTVSVSTLAATGHVYTMTINGIVVSYTSIGGDTQLEILNGLKAAYLSAFSAPYPANSAVTGSGSGSLLTFTGSVAGAGLAFTAVDTDLTQVNTTPAHSIASDIAAIQVVNDTWYGLSICSQLASDILQVAAYIETQFKIFIADSIDASILTTGATDVGSVLKSKSYKRTGILYGSVNDGRAAAWLGNQLPQVPGSSTWTYKNLPGIAFDILSPTAKSICVGSPTVPGKNVNIYISKGGIAMTQGGFMSGGQFIDITVGIDWLKSTMEVNVFSIIANSPKVPYTDAGVTSIENAIRQTIMTGVANGLIDGNSPIVVSSPLVLDIPANDRAFRLLPDISFSCRLQGAIHYVDIFGTVSV